MKHQNINPRIPNKRTSGAKTHSRLRIVFTNYQWHIIGVLALGVGIIGYSGFCLVVEPKLIRDYFKVLYLTIQLFVLESNIAYDQGMSLQLIAAQILAPLLFGYAAWKTAAALFREQFRLLGLLIRRDHVIIVGLGEKGIRLVKEYCRSGCKVVVIEPDPENIDVAVCWNHGATVLIGNGTDSEMLLRSRAHRARTIFIVTGDDGVNMEIAVKIHRLVTSQNITHTVRCYVHVIDANLSQFLKQQGLISDISDRFDARILNVSDIGARLLMIEHPLDHQSITANSARQPHLIIVGFGSMGESVALQAAKIGHFINGRSVRITVIDRDSHKKEPLLLARYPRFRDATRIEFVSMEIGSKEFFDTVVNLSREPGVLASIAVCIHDNTCALSYSFALHLRLGEIPIYVRLDTSAGPAALLEAKQNVSGKVIPFGQLDQTCTPEVIENETLDRIAAASHIAYVAKRSPNAKSGDCSVRPWDQLDISLKESNRAQADHIAVKLRGIGCSIVAVNCPGEAVTTFGDTELPALCRMEHARWNAERFLDGWQPGPEEDVPQKISPYLVPWDELSPDIQKYDTEAVNEIPALLKGIGMKIVRDYQYPESRIGKSPLLNVQ
jgi:hypothetical protein